LGLVDHHDGPLFLRLLLHEEGVELVDQLFSVVGVVGDAELIVDGLQQLFRAQLGVEDVGCDRGFVQALQEGAAQGGFAGSHLARDFDEPVALGNGIVQMAQCLLVAAAQEEVFRIRHQFEGFFSESEMGVVHGPGFLDQEVPMDRRGSAPMPRRRFLEGY
jgi:hypothetical protein